MFDATDGTQNLVLGPETNFCHSRCRKSQILSQSSDMQVTISSSWSLNALFAILHKAPAVQSVLCCSDPWWRKSKNKSDKINETRLKLTSVDNVLDKLVKVLTKAKSRSDCSRLQSRRIVSICERLHKNPQKRKKFQKTKQEFKSALSF